MPSTVRPASMKPSGSDPRVRRYVLRSVALVAGLATPGVWASTAGPGIVSIPRWPDLTLKGLQGQSLTTDAGPWRATLIDFWASWCTPCRLSFPWMNSLHERLSARGLRILAINLDRRREDAVRFLSAYPARFEIALDPTAQSASALNIQAMPTSMLLGQDGIIRWTHKGFRESDTEGLERRIQEALG
jgi:cytochrome c biogenesis protein CcmG/thiol:disulfide interchange protein DsbE